MPTLTIVLLTDNTLRELAGLRFLKTELQHTLRERNPDVRIIGSIAEVQHTLYKLHSIQPHIVFISQIQEKYCRMIAQYVKDSGALLFVLPSEVTPARSVQSLIVSSHMQYDQLLDGIFLPGKKMRSFFATTDISKQKLFVTGSPKIDVAFRSGGLDRPTFQKKYSLPPKRKNVFIFTSFPKRDVSYYESDDCFSENILFMTRVHQAIRQTETAYLATLPKICQALPDSNIILKPHPLEDTEKYSVISSPNFRTIKDASIVDCLPSIDLAIHWNSTVCTECWFHQIPTLQYSPVQDADWLLSDFSPGNPVFASVDKLIDSAQAILNKKRKLSKTYHDFQKGYIEENYYKPDSKSSQRIAQKVQRLLLKRIPQPAFMEQHKSFWTVVEFLHSITSVYVSRKLLSLLFRNYKWRYALENFVDE